MSNYGVQRCGMRIICEAERAELDKAKAEIERLRGEVEEWREKWAREFELRGDLAATIERRIVDERQRARLPEELVERVRDAMQDFDDGDGPIMVDRLGELLREAISAVEQGDVRIAEDYIDIVFDGPPGPVAGRFVEVEDSARRSIAFGEWTKRDDGFWVLRVANEQASAHRSAQIRAACKTALRALDTYEAMYRHHMTVQLYSARAGLREALDWRN